MLAYLLSHYNHHSKEHHLEHVYLQQSPYGIGHVDVVGAYAAYQVACVVLRFGLGTLLPRCNGDSKIGNTDKLELHCGNINKPSMIEIIIEVQYVCKLHIMIVFN